MFNTISLETDLFSFTRQLPLKLNCMLEYGCTNFGTRVLLFKDLNTSSDTPVDFHDKVLSVFQYLNIYSLAQTLDNFFQ